jgi:CubicO group peptidase (beta-lactamase class C family)
MAQIGQLMLQDGMWNGEQIVSSAWLTESARLHIPVEGYGYYWWIAEENDLFYAEGHGGQVIFVARSQDLAIVLTADPYSASAALSPGMYDLFDQILDAIIG